MRHARGLASAHHERDRGRRLPSDTNHDGLKAQITEVLADDDKTLWLHDRHGKDVAIPSAKIAYVGLGTADSERRIGFGAA